MQFISQADLIKIHISLCADQVLFALYLEIHLIAVWLHSFFQKTDGCSIIASSPRTWVVCADYPLN
jgi:hypothetical protein